MNIWPSNLPKTTQPLFIVLEYINFLGFLTNRSYDWSALELVNYLSKFKKHENE